MADLDGTTFLTGANAGFIAELYTRFLEDPQIGRRELAPVFLGNAR